ncbi:hypothetical protein DWB84_11225 [Saccharophagus sp. K07]|nr:hypothetical protein [Saccharophagus sp. K07]
MGAGGKARGLLNRAKLRRKSNLEKIASRLEWRFRQLWTIIKGLVSSEKAELCSAVLVLGILIPFRGRLWIKLTNYVKSGRSRDQGGWWQKLFYKTIE